MASAMIEEPPSASKLALIREFLRASGLQAAIDSGGLLDHLGAPGAPSFAYLTEGLGEMTYGDSVSVPRDAVRAAYAPHRQVWQEEYESHANWEFTEAELEQIVAFLKSEAGQHYQEARWRMTAYIGTNTEALTEDILKAAREALVQRFRK